MAGPLKSLKDANPASAGGDKKSVGGPLPGYTEQGYPSAGPAMSNSDLSGYGENTANLGQDGTSAGAYHKQPKTVSAKNPAGKR